MTDSRQASTSTRRHFQPGAGDSQNGVVRGGRASLLLRAQMAALRCGGKTTQQTQYGD
jgi:hypothetical protein